MPDCYTHAWVATEALMRSGNTVASHPAFLAGANGPDPLFMYHITKKVKRPNLPALAAKMHLEDTGAFLLALIRNATTQLQQSFAMGFVIHYTTDCTLNPYIAAMGTPGGPYPGERGHVLMEAAIDSALYYRNYKTRLVPLHAGTPALITEDLAQVSTLLRESILEAYGRDIPLIALSDTYHDNFRMRRLLTSRTGLKKPLVRFLLAGKGRYAAQLPYRMQPAKPLKNLPQHWTNPYTESQMNLTFDEVLALCIQTGAVCATATMRYWLGELDEAKLADVLGNNDYYTGQPCTPAEPPPAQGGEPTPAAP